MSLYIFSDFEFHFFWEKLNNYFSSSFRADVDLQKEKIITQFGKESTILQQSKLSVCIQSREGVFTWSISSEIRNNCDNKSTVISAPLFIIFVLLDKYKLLKGRETWIGSWWNDLKIQKQTTKIKEKKILLFDESSLHFPLTVALVNGFSKLISRLFRMKNSANTNHFDQASVAQTVCSQEPLQYWTTAKSPFVFS